MFAKKENPHSTVNQKNDLIFNYKSKAEKNKWSFHDIYNFVKSKMIFIVLK
jgi:hypothetical protein